MKKQSDAETHFQIPLEISDHPTIEETEGKNGFQLSASLCVDEVEGAMACDGGFLGPILRLVWHKMFPPEGINMCFVKLSISHVLPNYKIPNVKWEDVGELEDVKKLILGIVEAGFSAILFLLEWKQIIECSGDHVIMDLN